MTSTLMPASADAASPFHFSYSGRLTESNGQPLKGPVDLSFRFFRSEIGNDEILGISVPIFTNVVLQEGIFHINFPLSAADMNLIFNGTDTVWIQVADVTHDRIYPRQTFSAAPYALKVPVDGQSLNYDVDGKLVLSRPKSIFIQSPDAAGAVKLQAPSGLANDIVLTLPSNTGVANQFLKTDGAGNLTWGSATGSGGGDMVSTNNLADLANASTARTNLGLGDSATKNVGTAAGTVAAGDHGHTAANISDFNTAVAAAPAVTANTAKNSYPAADATKVGHLTVTGAVDLDAMKTAVAGHTTTLSGLGDAATKDVGTAAGTVAAGDHTHTGYLSASSNLSDVSNATTARTNLGLGDLATKSEVGSLEITNDSITDLDVASNAAIAGGKITPNFGNQNVITTGSVTANASKLKAASNTGVSTLKVPDNQASTLTFTLPDGYGSSGQVLKSDGAGGLSWETLSGGSGGDMFKADNLSGLGNTATARTNLGLGDSATKNVGTAAGTVAAGDHGHTAANISDFNTAVAASPAVTANTAKNSYPAADATKVGHLTVTGAVDLDAMKTAVAGHTTTLSGLGDAATKDVGTAAGTVAAGDHGHTAANISDFNTAVAAAPAVTANTAKNSYPTADATKVGHLTVTGAVDLDAMKTAVAGHTTTLSGLGDAATKDVGTAAGTVAAGDHTHTGYLSASSNLSDVASATTARTNLGLGDLATKDKVGSGDITAGSIVDADIAAGAAISGSKISGNIAGNAANVTGVVGVANGGTGADLSATGGAGQYLKQTSAGAAVTVAQIAASDLPTMVGDSGSGGVKGAVPAATAGDAAAGKFLKANGTWAVPPTNLPPGMIQAFAGETCPSGWLAAAGAAVSRTTYQNLFAYIGTMYGAGDGSTTFKLPDLRGEFLRGWAAGSIADPDANNRSDRGDGTTGGVVGTRQLAVLGSHAHGPGTLSGVATTAGAHHHSETRHVQIGINAGAGGFAVSGANTTTVGTGSAGDHTHPVSISAGLTGATGGNENRPRNVAVLYCISY